MYFPFKDSLLVTERRKKSLNHLGSSVWIYEKKYYTYKRKQEKAFSRKPSSHPYEGDSNSTLFLRFSTF